MKKGERLRGGFTVIEVTLVLAVAGLIFAMAFIAVPALQRTQRDNTRRDDMMTFVSEVKRFQTSNRGNLPTVGSTIMPIDWETASSASSDAGTWASFYNKYLGERFMDPDGEHYKLNVVACGVKYSKADDECDSNVLKLIDDMKSDSFKSNDYKILVITRGKCSGESVLWSSSPRNLAVLYRLEGAGVYCYGT